MMVVVKCSECAAEINFPIFIPSAGKEVRCINCEISPICLGMWLKATRDPAERKRILNRLAALKLKRKS